MLVTVIYLFTRAGVDFYVFGVPTTGGCIHLCSWSWHSPLWVSLFKIWQLNVSDVSACRRHCTRGRTYGGEWEDPDRCYID